MQQQRSQCVLNYPLRPENPSNILYSYKSDFCDDELNDRIVQSKSLFKFEDQCLTVEEKRKQKFNDLAQAQNPHFKSYLELIDPMDRDFNYTKIEKLSHEFMYEYIEQQIKKFQNTQEVLRVFQKKNDNINFFLSDYDGIIQNTEIDVMKEQNKKSNTTQVNQNKDSNDLNQQNQTKISLMAKQDTHSQGKAFFYAFKGHIYEQVKKYPDDIYIEIKNTNDQIGIFKMKDFDIFEFQNSMILQTSASSNNLNIHNESKIKDTPPMIEQDDHSDISIRSKKISISNQPINGLQSRKKSYTATNNATASKKNILNSSINTTPLRSAQNSSLKYSAQMSTAATRRY